LVSRFYQDTGYPDDNWIVGMDQTASRFRSRSGLHVGHGPGGEYSTPAWEHHFPGMLRFLFPHG